MMLSDMERVIASFRRCSADCEFMDHFYQRFMESSPQVTAKFARVDMDHQAVMMRGSLEMMLQGSLHPNGLTALAELHSRRGIGISPSLYDLWLDSLLSTVRAYDDECGEELLAAWRRVLLPGIQAMAQSY